MPKFNSDECRSMNYRYREKMYRRKGTYVLEKTLTPLKRSGNYDSLAECDVDIIHLLPDDIKDFDEVTPVWTAYYPSYWGDDDGADLTGFAIFKRGGKLYEVNNQYCKN